MKYRYTYLILTIILSIQSVCIAQPNQTDNLVNELFHLWSTHYSSYEYNPLDGEISNFNKILEQSDKQEKYKTNLLLQINNYESDLIKKDWGLNAGVGYLENLSPVADEADNLIYNRRVSAGIDWNIMKNGYLSNQVKSKIKTNEGIILKSKIDLLDKRTSKLNKWHSIMYLFNLQKIKLLRKRYEIAEVRVIVATKLHALKKTTQEEFLKQISSKAEIESMLHIYESYNREISNFIDTSQINITPLPLVDIDYVYSLELLGIDNTDSVTMAKLENIDLNNKLIHDITLKTFLKYNFYDLAIQDPSYRSFFSIGLQLGIPVRFAKKKKENLISLKKEAISTVPDEQYFALQNDVLTDFYEFRYKLKQFNGFYYKRLLLNELLRKQDAKYKIAPLSFNPLKSLRTLDELMHVDIELLDLKQQMYLKLLNIYTTIPNIELSKFCSVTSIKGIDKSKSFQANSIYIWNKSLNKYSLDYLIGYLKLNNISTAITSLNSDNYNKVNNLSNQLLGTGVNLELMLSNNKLTSENFNDYINSIGVNIEWKNVTALHLDVEPHTKDDWHENKDAYLNLYLELVQKAKEFTTQKGIELNVSIPLHYPKEIVDSLYSSCDKIYFMAYENIKASYIFKKASVYPEEKTVIALRTKDFSDRLVLEEKIEELKEHFKLATFCIHDFDSLIELDKKEIRNIEND